jgi:mutator protein MutT
MVSYAFETLNVRRITAHCDADNIGSARSLPKIGFTYEGCLRKARRRADGTYADEFAYGILAEDYFKRSDEENIDLGYIMNLRRYVGHMPLIMCGAGVLVENAQGEILLQRRRDDGMWCDSSGGSLELGENVEDCAKRELFEETGLTALSLEYLGVFSGNGMRHTYPNGDIVDVVSHIYICRDWSGELKPQESEVAELRWFALDKLPENTLPDLKLYLDAYLRQKRVK